MAMAMGRGRKEDGIILEASGKTWTGSHIMITINHFTSNPKAEVMKQLLKVQIIASVFRHVLEI